MMASIEGPVTIKRYAGQRLHGPAAAAYVSLDDLAAMVADGEDFVVTEASTGEDITPSILKQIVSERVNHG